MNYEERLQDLLDELDLFQDWTERYEYIISLGKKLPRLDEAILKLKRNGTIERIYAKYGVTL